MIPLKIDKLLKGRVVEQNRVEYKSGWNPADTIHTICAFANDFSNVNGGYIVIGIDAPSGIPALPPRGVPKEQLDAIQQEIFQYCNKIEPRYIPKIEVVNYHDTDIYLLYLRCSAGENGPYQAPMDVYSSKQSGKKTDKTMRYWIRPASITTYAKQDEIAELFDKFNAVPYDDRVNRSATIDYIRRGFLEDFLRESGSSLAGSIDTSTIKDLLIALEVANETDTDLAIRNIGVLMFSDRPHKLIPGAQIDLVKFDSPEEEGADFTEKTFTGPIFKQVRDALDYIKTNIIVEKVVKIDNQAEAERFFNYPYNALEEVLVNAVFHKSYRDHDPVEIRIYLDRILIINYPGPAKWIDMDKLAAGEIISRRYRNRRIGEFFKEIELSEKQSTGITKVLRELKQNGSPPLEFETEPDRNYLIATIRMRDGFESISGNVGTNVGTNVGENGVKEKILEIISGNPTVRAIDIAEIIKTTPRSVERYISELKKAGLIERIGPKKGGHWLVK
jgi:ATP-dependent DNA helicase RecG